MHKPGNWQINVIKMFIPMILTQVQGVFWKKFISKTSSLTFMFPERCSVNHSVMPDSLHPWTIACHAPLSRGFLRQEHWSGLWSPSSGESSQRRDRTWVSCIAGSFFTIWATGKTYFLTQVQGVFWKKFISTVLSLIFMFPD